jgi:hypothetical protein
MAFAHFASAFCHIIAKIHCIFGCIVKTKESTSPLCPTFQAFDLDISPNKKDRLGRIPQRSLFLF